MGAFNGSGVFVRSYSWTNDAANNIDITASRSDTEDDGFAAGLTLCVTRDGQGRMAFDFLPSSTNAYGLGSLAFPWKALFCQYIQATASATSAFGPTANALVDATPDTGTFSGTFSGCSGTVTGTCTWYRVGKLVFLTFPATANGTSNGNFFALTAGLPGAITPATLSQVVAVDAGSMKDNGTGVSSSGKTVSASLTAGSGQINFLISGGANSWTGAGGKGFTNNTTICYLAL